MPPTPVEPVAWYCQTCKKFDLNDTVSGRARPEHIPYRGQDIGTCPGKFEPLYRHTADPAAVAQVVEAARDVLSQYPLIHPQPVPAWIRNLAIALQALQQQEASL